MTHKRLYRPVRRVPASRLRGADGSMRQAPRRSAGYVEIPTCDLRRFPCGDADGPMRPAPFRHTPNRPWPRQATSVWRNLDQHPRFAGTHTFSAKEKDTETGYSYFGSRYYNSDLSIWLSVDPMADKYPSMSPYVYCADNPVKLVDPNGESIINPYKRLIDECNAVIMELEEGIKGQKYNYPSLAKAALVTTKEELKEYTNYSRREYKQRHSIPYDE